MAPAAVLVFESGCAVLWFSSSQDLHVSLVFITNWDTVSKLCSVKPSGGRGGGTRPLST